MSDIAPQHRCDRVRVIADVVSFYVLPYVVPVDVGCLRACSRAAKSTCDRGTADSFVELTIVPDASKIAMRLGGRHRQAMLALR